MTNVNLEARYSAAWSELNTRLQSRQTVMVGFSTVSVAVVGIVFAIGIAQAIVAVAFMLPLLAVGFSFWSYQNDITIGLLSKFCAECECFEDNKDDDVRPSWHSPKQEWMNLALKYRKLGAAGFLLTILSSCIPAAYVFLVEMTNTALDGVIMAIAVACLASAITLTILTIRKRKEIKDNYGLVNVEGTLRFQKTGS